MPKLLLIGPLRNKNDVTNTGGVTILFELLLSELRTKGIEFDVIDTLKDNYPNPATAFFSSALKLITQFHKYDHISLQASNNSLVLLGPVMILLSKIYNKKTSMRKFAGNLNVVYEKSNFFKKMTIRYVLKNMDVNFFETKYLVDYFHKFNNNTYWFPNVRQQILIPKLPKNFSKRFIYIGTINKEKGIDEIVKIASELDDDYTLDLFGPILEKKYAKKYFHENKTNYYGHLHPDRVTEVLNTYDILILPSYREGYPGVIIEAFSLGIPVIVTKLEGIKEMVTHNYNGLLIDLKNSQQLKSAIESVDQEGYQTLSNNALKSFSNFNSKEQTYLFLKKIGIDV